MNDTSAAVPVEGQAILVPALNAWMTLEQLRQYQTYCYLRTASVGWKNPPPVSNREAEDIRA